MLRVNDFFSIVKHGTRVLLFYQFYSYVILMLKVLIIFIVTFSVVMIFNQIGYGSCFSSYCMSAATPKVTVISIVLSAFIYWVSRNETK